MSRAQLTTDRLARALGELALTETVPAEAADLEADVLAAIGRTRQRRWTAPMWWLPQSEGSRAAQPGARLLVVAGLLLILVLVISIIAGGAMLRDSVRPYLGVLEPRAPLLVARAGPAAVPLADGRVLIAGGELGGTDTPAAEVYDPVTGSSTRVGDLLMSTRLGARLSDGRVLFLGDVADPSPSMRQEGEVFDPASGTFAALPALRLDDDVATVVGLDHDRVLIVDFGVRGVREFDARRGSLSDLSPMPAGVRVNGDIAWSGTVLADGRVLLAAETGGPLVIVDPGSLRTELAGSAAPVGPCIAALPDGRAVVFGEAGMNPPADRRMVAAIYDPATDTARSAAPAPGLADRCIALRDGRVLVVFRQDLDGNAAADPVVYDPGLDAYAPTGGTAARGGFERVIALVNGDVLLLGGRSDPSSQAPGTMVELFR